MVMRARSGSIAHPGHLNFEQAISNQSLCQCLAAVIPFVSLGEPFESDFPLCLPGERSIGKDRISEILVLVNITEKTTLPEFSVRLFVSVLLLGSQVCAPNGPLGGVSPGLHREIPRRLTPPLDQRTQAG